MARQKLKNIYLLALSFFILLIYVLIVEIPKAQKKSDLENRGERIFASIKKDYVTSIFIKKYPNSNVKLEKTGIKWQIVLPKKYKTDTQAVSSYLDSLQNAVSQRSIKADVSGLAQFGLDKPMAHIIITTKKTNYKLIFGNEFSLTPSVQDQRRKSYKEVIRYAMIEGSKRINMIRSYTANMLMRKINYFRYKNIFSFSKEDISSFSFNYKGKNFSFLKKKNDWQMIRPVSKKAESGKVNLFLNGFEGFIADDFESDRANPAVYGIRFYKNFFKVRTKTGQKIIAFGKEKGNFVYCAVSGSPAVYKVSKFKFDNLKKKSADFLKEKKKVKPLKK